MLLPFKWLLFLIALSHRAEARLEQDLASSTPENYMIESLSSSVRAIPVETFCPSPEKVSVSLPCHRHSLALS